MLCSGCSSFDRKDSAIGQKVRLNRDARIIYLALGDSTGTGVGGKNGSYVDLIWARIQQKYPTAQLVNLSTPWATTADMIREMKQSPVEQASLVTISIGINDLMQGLSTEQFVRNYEEIISTLEKTGPRIVITNLPNISLAPALPKARQNDMTTAVTAFNRQIEEIAKRHNLPLIDLYQISTSIIQLHPEAFSADGFHPSEAGYVLWADAMWPIVEKEIQH